jgi:hypothetical protein
MNDEIINPPHVEIMETSTVSQDIQALEGLAHIMDSAIVIPGTSIRVGIDSLIGLIPGIGDTISALISSYIVQQASKYNLPWHLKLHMAFNIFMDWLIGIVPLIGDLFDIGWKANIRNVELLKKHIAKQTII